VTRSPFRAAHAANRALAGVLALGAITIPLGLAAEIVVDTDQDTEIPDDGVTSLREAVTDAGASPGSDRITFSAALAGATILLGSQMEVADPDFVIDGCEFRENDSRTSGGAIQLNDSEATITNSTFLLNEAGFGGAISIEGGPVTISHSVFEENRTPEGVGGAVYAFDAMEDLSASHCRFTDNQAESGGAIYFSAVFSSEIVDCLFERNSALEQFGFPQGGGAVKLGTARCTLHRCSLIGNRSEATGGALSIDLAFELSATNCTFADNEARTNGGAIESNQSSPTFTHCTIHANRAGTGGGTYSRTGAINLHNCVMAENTATIDGDDAEGDIALRGTCFIGANDGNNVLGPPSAGPGQKNFRGQYIGTPENPFDPRLAPLAVYRGDLPTLPPLPGSPLIDSADPAYGLSVGVDDSQTDSDRDGSPDGEELRNMTDSLSSADYLRILAITPREAPAAVTVRWSSFPGLSYHLLESAALDFGNATVTTAGPANDFTHELTVPRPALQSFFQVRRD